MKRYLLVLGLPLLLWSNQFDATLENEIQWLEEESFVVSASRVKENIKKTSASISIIDEDMISKMGLNNLTDVLATISGISVSQSAIYFKEIASRGIKDFTSKHILFMIDGHSIDAILLNGGSTAVLDNMPLHNVKRIEVIKGPASALYGANAFTGLVNIITKNASDIDGSIVNSKIGSYNTKELNLLYGKQYEDLSIVANINFYKTDGNSVFVKKDRANNSATTDPYLEQLHANIKLDYKNFYLSTMYIKRDDGSYFGPLGEVSNDNNPKLDYFYMESGYKQNINKMIDLSTRIYFDRYTTNNRWHLLTIPGNVDMKNAFKNTKQGIEVLGTVKINQNFTSILGTTYEKHKQYDIQTITNGVNLSNTPNSFAPNVNRDMKAFYLNNLYDLNNNVRFTFGIRYDDYSDFDSNTAPRGGVSWQIDENNILKFMYGEGFRTPTFAEAYNVSSIIQGNTNLIPEKVKTYETTFENTYFTNTITKFTYFNNEFTDLITQSGNIYINSGKTKTEGLEFEAKYNLPRGSYILANYTYQKAKNTITNTDLANIAKHKGNIFLNYKINKYFSSFNHLVLKGKTKRAVGDTRDEVSGYGIFNSSLIAKNLYKKMQFKVSINNVFNKKAYDPSNINYTFDDYEKEGRNFMFEVSYKF